MPSPRTAKILGIGQLSSLRQRNELTNKIIGAYLKVNKNVMFCVTVLTEKVLSKGKMHMMVTCDCSKYLAFLLYLTHFEFSITFKPILPYRFWAFLGLGVNEVYLIRLVMCDWMYISLRWRNMWYIFNGYMIIECNRM